MGRRKQAKENPATRSPYVTNEVRSKRTSLRIYVTSGEQRLIDDAIKKSMRVPNRSEFMANAVLKRSCQILGIPYPYPELD